MRDVITILKDVGAITGSDHFVGTSGRHFNTYLNKDMLFPHIKAVSDIGLLFARKYTDMNIDVVAAPALGGIVLSQWTAHHLGKLTRREVLAVYTEKDEHMNHVFNRGYDLFVKGKNVLVIEDLATTGGSVLKCAESVKKAGGNVRAICVMVNREPGNISSEIQSLAEYPVVSYEAKDCPMCKQGMPVNIKMGHGKKFVTSQGQ